MSLANLIVLGLAVGAAAGAAAAAQPPQRQLVPVPFTDVKFTDAFWAPRIETNRTRTIPYCFKQCEDTGRITNFDKAAGRLEGKFEGIYFNDSDLYKVIEGAAYALAAHPDPALDQYVDGIIARVAAAQQKDGYLYTFYTVNKTLDKRFTDCRGKHEMYCAGHLFEAAAAHFRATGKRSLLDVAARLADHLDSTFGPDKRHDIEGHPEPELALVKLYEATGQERYLRLAAFFIGEHGHTCGRRLYGEYSQDHTPLVDQTEPVGHAVRAMYFYSGATDIVAYRPEAPYRKALEAIWQNLTTRKMHVTGGVGARHSGEAFGDAFELPNESAYCETCAAIGCALWSHRMNLLTGDARYADVVERVLYNGFLSGVSLDGEKFFYVNPLASRGNHHRQPWFGCACCPVNVARLVPSIPGYVYAHNAEGIYVNLYVASTATVRRQGGAVTLTQETGHPWDGRVTIRVEPDLPAAFTLALRIPYWARGQGEADDLYRFAEASPGPMTVKVNGTAVADLALDKGYARLRREWKKGDVVELALPMPVRRVYAHPAVEADRGRVALQRGPIVYCSEGVDNGKALAATYLPADAPVTAEHRPDLLGGVTVLRTRGQVRRLAPEAPAAADLTAVPYYAWDHREAGPMVVWLAEKPDAAAAPRQPTPASGSKVSVSHCWHADTADALNDQVEPKNSLDHEIPRLTWWDHRGTTEWVQYDFAKPARVAGVEVYWFDDANRGGCRVPKAWRVLAKVGGQWKPVEGASPGGVEKDKYNAVTFPPVQAEGLRLEVDLQPNFSGGILEWRVTPAK